MPRLGLSQLRHEQYKRKIRRRHHRAQDRIHNVVVRNEDERYIHLLRAARMKRRLLLQKRKAYIAARLLPKTLGRSARKAAKLLIRTFSKVRPVRGKLSRIQVAEQITRRKLCHKMTKGDISHGIDFARRALASASYGARLRPAI